MRGNRFIIQEGIVTAMTLIWLPAINTGIEYRVRSGQLYE
jgi:hypothetical protein